VRSRHALRQPSLGAATAPGPAPGRPNLWPDAELPELRPAFQALGRLVVAAGLLLARRCDAYAAGRASAVPTLASSLCFAPMRARARAAGRAVPCCAVQRLLVWTSTRPRRLARGRRSAAARRVRQQPPRHASNTCMCVRAGATSCTAARQAAPPCAGPGAAARPCLGLHDVLARSPCHKGRLLHYYPLPPAPGARPADAPRPRRSRRRRRGRRRGHWGPHVCGGRRGRARERGLWGGGRGRRGRRAGGGRGRLVRLAPRPRLAHRRGPAPRTEVPIPALQVAILCSHAGTRACRFHALPRHATPPASLRRLHVRGGQDPVDHVLKVGGGHMVPVLPRAREGWHLHTPVHECMSMCYSLPRAQGGSHPGTPAQSA
jgi:hypothetical protein